MDTLKERFQEIENAALKMKLQEREVLLKQYAPKPYWSEASRSLVMRLRGIYAIGPGADQTGPNDEPEFGWRHHQGMPPIQFEAAQRIQDLDEELEKYRASDYETITNV